MKKILTILLVIILLLSTNSFASTRTSGNVVTPNYVPCPIWGTSHHYHLTFFNKNQSLIGDHYHFVNTLPYYCTIYNVIERANYSCDCGSAYGTNISYERHEY